LLAYPSGEEGGDFPRSNDFYLPHCTWRGGGGGPVSSLWFEAVFLKVSEDKSVRKCRGLTNVHLQEDGGEEGDDPDQTLSPGDTPVFPHLNYLR
jgi:hypothetical protein